MQYFFSGHVFQRMAERQVSPNMIKAIIKNGTVIKEYPDDTPYPSRLILGFDGKRPLHVVSAYNPANDVEYVITVYEPYAEQWSNNFTERR